MVFISISITEKEGGRGACGEYAQGQGSRKNSRSSLPKNQNENGFIVLPFLLKIAITNTQSFSVSK